MNPIQQTVKEGETLLAYYENIILYPSVHLHSIFTNKYLQIKRCL